MSATVDEDRRQHGRDRSEAYRDRRRHGRMQVPVEIGPRHIAALERLALMERGERRTFRRWAPWPADEEEAEEA